MVIIKLRTALNQNLYLLNCCAVYLHANQTYSCSNYFYFKIRSPFLALITYYFIQMLA